MKMRLGKKFSQITKSGLSGGDKKDAGGMGKNPLKEGTLM